MIDENKLMEEVKRWKRKVDKDCGEMPNVSYLTGYLSALSVVEGMIAEQPTVDAVEVVRCKECKHTGDLTSKNHYDQVWCNRVGYWKDNDWYCADGERKSDGND